MNNEATAQQTPLPRKTLWQLIRELRNPRLLWIFVLGVSSGAPRALLGSCTSAWLKQEGFTRTTIGFFSLVSLPFAINFLWGPVVDHIRIPLLNRLGSRRSWLILCLSVMFLITFSIGVLNPLGIGSDEKDSPDIEQVSEESQSAEDVQTDSEETVQQPNYIGLYLLALLLLVMAVSSATQDIVTAAYRITIIRPDEQHLVGWGATMETSGWWVGFGLMGAIAFLLVGDLELYLLAWCHISRTGSIALLVLDNIASGWPLMFMFLSMGFICIALFVLFVLKEPDRTERLQLADSGVVFTAWDWVMKAYFGAVAEFFKRTGFFLALFLLLFLFSFKLGEAFLGTMSTVFYLEIGYTEDDIGTFSKLIGTIIAVGSAILSGLVIGRFRTIPALFIGGIAMAATNLMFSWIALEGPNLDLYFWTVVMDGITTGFSSCAFVAFISHYVSRLHSGTQYAALSSIGTLGKTSLAGFSGLLVDFLQGNWVLFFILTSVAVIPSLICLLIVRNLIGSAEQFAQSSKPIVKPAQEN